MGQAQNNTFKGSSDGTAELANTGLQWVDIYHVPTGYAVNFKAMITNFTDQYASEWNSESVFGRMDPIQTFQRTGRTIDIGFDVVAGSKEEAINNLERVSTFVQFLYPSYDAQGLIKNSPFCKIQFLNWMASTHGTEGTGKFSVAKNDGILGAINGFSFEPDLEAGVFVGADKKIYPKVLNISFTFNVLHDHKLGWEGTISRAGNRFPYLQDITTVLSKKGDKRTKFPAPTSSDQSKAVPNDNKEEATAKTLTRPAGMTAAREAELRKLGHSAARIRSGHAEKDESERLARQAKLDKFYAAGGGRGHWVGE